MIQVYFNDILQAQRDIININDDCITEVIREDGFNSTEQIIRERFEASISFTGDAYKYVSGLFKADPCKIINVRLVNECQIEFNGTFGIESMDRIIGGGKCICKVPLKDNSFSAYIRDYLDVDVQTYATKTRNCEPISTVIKNFLMPNDPNTPGNRTQVRAFDVLDLMKYIVEFHTDNGFTVESEYLTNNKLAIATGAGLSSAVTTIDKLFPTISYQRIFDEVRKKKRIYQGIEYRADNSQYLSVELETHFYANSKLFSIVKMPKDSKPSYDRNRLFNQINAGSNITEVQDGTPVSYPQKRYTAWNKESYQGCGTCNGDKDNKLELTSDVIIDSNIIFEGVSWSGASEFPHNDDLFMFEYEVIDGLNYGKVTLDSETGTYYYNAGLTNDSVLQNWISYYSRCLAIQRSAKYGFLAQSSDFLRTNGSIGYACGDSHLSFGTVIYDNESALSNGTYNNYASPCSPFLVNDNHKRFIATEVGNYNFRATITNIKQVGGSLETNDVTHELHIYVYTDTTYGTPIMDFNDSVTVPLGYDVANLSVETGDIALAVGNVVVVYQKVSIGSGFFLEDFEFTPDYKSFELISDDFTCDSIENNVTDGKPYVVDFDYPLCADHYKAILANKKGYIELAGTKQWIRHIKYRHNKISSLTLIGDEYLDEC